MPLSPGEEGHAESLAEIDEQGLIGVDIREFLACPSIPMSMWHIASHRGPDDDAFNLLGVRPDSQEERKQFKKLKKNLIRHRLFCSRFGWYA